MHPPAALGQPLRGLRRGPRRQGHDGAGRRARVQRRAERDEQRGRGHRRRAPVAARLTQRKLQLVLDLDHTLLECSTDKRASSVEGVVSLGNVAGRPHWVRLTTGPPPVLRCGPAVVRTRHLHSWFEGLRGRRRQGFNRKVPGTSFGGRVVSRDDCPDLRGEKSLARLFPGGAARALILDDRLDVWTRGVDQTARVLVVQPYKFFEHHFRDPSRRDGDAQLSHSARALCAAHAAFYPSNGRVEDDVVACLDRSRTKVFAGCSLLFAEEVDIYAARCARALWALAWSRIRRTRRTSGVGSGPMTKQGGRTWTGSGTASGAAGASPRNATGRSSLPKTGRGSGAVAGTTGRGRGRRAGCGPRGGAVLPDFRPCDVLKQTTIMRGRISHASRRPSNAGALQMASSA